MLEYNCRLGDPETEAVMLRADFDLAKACMLAANGELAGFEAKWFPGASVCVVIASKGYPGDPQTGVEILWPGGCGESARRGRFSRRDARQRSNLLYKRW